MTVPSPCTDVCSIDEATGWCRGCLRSLDEIAAWGTLGDLAKRAVWKQLPVRRAARREAGVHDDTEAAP
ncbi:MAG: DUF1289 domain-containing protein [Caldimonas sp.]